VNLFSRRKPRESPPPDFNLPQTQAGEFSLPMGPASIPLSEELRAILDQPVDPRTERIIREIAEEGAVAEAATHSERIIRFPVGGSVGDITRDSAGQLTAVSGEPPAEAASLG
jgi:hypothetical protein